jgi:acetyl-CoA carboxylase biotin carboxylase subunit
MFKKILIANRGEIALRIIRACRDLEITTVAIYSEADRKALHVRYADEAYCVGPPPAIQSYLNIEKILEIAQAAKVEAIHPGYGFLSENAIFARRCEEEGVVFIGPSSQAIQAMGNKTAARKIALQEGVPIVPGTEDVIEDDRMAMRLAEEIGFPVVIKAAAGGGGKGMRIVRNSRDMESALRSARSEARSAFGDPSVYLEKYIEEPRHIEIQVLGDKYGKMLYLGERECSIQRRHQKLIEESPSVLVDPDLRQRMGKTAVKAALAAGYYNAGTLEFLVDKNKNFYFLEMNTRLQVEHPVTEMVTGIDLVKEQIKIAAGERLSYSQEEIRLNGAAMECRIYAEDPENHFMPSPGKILVLQPPLGPWIRVDSGTFQGDEISVYYDSMIAKLIVWGRNRQEVLQRMSRALDEFKVLGIKTTIPFHKKVMKNPHFIAGNFHTHFIDSQMLYGSAGYPLEEETNADELRDVALIAASLAYKNRKDSSPPTPSIDRNILNPWKWMGRQQALRRGF